MKFLSILPTLLFLGLPIIINGQNVGVGTLSPPQKLSIQGKISIADDSEAPSAGTIRFNSSTSDFEGWTGTKWKSLTFNLNDISKAQPVPGVNDDAYIGFSTSMGISYAATGATNNSWVHIFRKTNDCWGWQFPIPATSLANGTFFDGFGHDIELIDYGFNTFLVVGAPFNNINGVASGIVGVYSLSPENAQKKFEIDPADGGNSDYFGYSISSYGLDLAISAPQADNAQIRSGSVYIYSLAQDGSSATALQKITSPQEQYFGLFGNNVLLSGLHLFIQAKDEDIGGVFNPGRVYHYTRTINGPFVFQNVIENPEPQANGAFGRVIEFHDNTLMISSINSTTNIHHGAIYVYELNTTTNQFSNAQKLIAPNSLSSISTHGDNFGQSLTLYADKMVVSATGYDANGKNSGSLFLFNFNGSSWKFTKTLKVSDPMPNNYLGTSLSNRFIFENTIMVGSHLANDFEGTVHFLNIK